MNAPLTLTIDDLLADLEAIVESAQAVDISSIITAFATHDIVGEIKGCASLSEAILRVVSIVVPGAVIGELGVEVLAFIAIAIVEMDGSPFNVVIHAGPPPDPAPIVGPDIR